MRFHFLPRSLRAIPPSSFVLPLLTFTAVALIIIWGDVIPLRQWLAPVHVTEKERSALTERISRIKGVVAPDQTFTSLMEGFGVPPDVTAQLIRTARPLHDLGLIHPGNEYIVVTGERGELRGFEYYADIARLLRITEKEGTFVSELVTVPYETRLSSLDITVRTSLYEDLLSAGADAGLARSVRTILGAWIDFTSDLRPGDRCRLLYEEKARDGRILETGRILAAEVEVRGSSISAYYFEKVAGRGEYYTEDGHTVRRRFLAAPFPRGRLPGNIRRNAHDRRWIEYAAPAVTPVAALAEGIVVFAGTDKALGTTVVIRHGDGYSSRYSFLAGLADGVGKGFRVSRGTLIGHVGKGKKGRAYLEFRLKHGQSYIDAMSPPDIPAGTIPTADLQRFAALVREWSDLLHQAKGSSAPAARSKPEPMPPATLR